MTKGDYEILAKALAKCKPEPGNTDVSRMATITWQRSVAEIALACYDENPKFDHVRFGTACNKAKEKRDE